MTDFDDTLAENAAKPAEFEQDGAKAKQHSLKDQIEYAKYTKGQQANTASKGFGIKFAKIVPPGAAG